MDVRMANESDLPQIKAVYGKIIEKMEQDKVPLWDDVYPCEFFEEDIRREQLYVLTEQNEILAAFALCDSNAGEACVQWEDKQAKACYIDRLGVNVDYLRKGIAGLALQKAAELARERGAEYVRLFVVDFNEPAIKLYRKSGFQRAGGFYDEVIDDDLVLHEFGFEIKTAKKP